MATSFEAEVQSGSRGRPVDGEFTEISLVDGDAREEAEGREGEVEESRKSDSSEDRASRLRQR